MDKSIFEMAREFAGCLLETNEGKRYQEAKYIFEGDDEAMNLLSEYSKIRQDFQGKRKRGESGQEFERLRSELNSITEEIKKDEIVTNLFKTEEEFNALVSAALDIFNTTLTGDDLKQTKKGCCGSGGCGGCTGC